MRIFISSLFRDLLEIDQSCLELGYFRLGSLDGIRDNNGKFIENLNDLRVSYIEQDKRRSPTSGVYTFDGVIFKNENKHKKAKKCKKPKIYNILIRYGGCVCKIRRG